MTEVLSKLVMGLTVIWFTNIVLGIIWWTRYSFSRNNHKKLKANFSISDVC